MASTLMLTAADNPFLVPFKVTSFKSLIPAAGKPAVLAGLSAGVQASLQEFRRDITALNAKIRGLLQAEKVVALPRLIHKFGLPLVLLERVLDDARAKAREAKRLKLHEAKRARIVAAVDCDSESDSESDDLPQLRRRIQDLVDRTTLLLQQTPPDVHGALALLRELHEVFAT